MQHDLRITWLGLTPLAEAEAEIQTRVHALEIHTSGSLQWEVVIDRPHRHHRRGALFEVSVVMTLQGEESAILRHSGEQTANNDLLLAIRDSFDALSRQLQAQERPDEAR